MAQRIVSVSPGSLAARHGIVPGETLLSINGTPVLDLIDYQFLTACPVVHLVLEAEDGTQRTETLHKHTSDALGLTLACTLMSCPKTCANRCIFCFIEQMPPGMRPSLYVRDDDWRLSLMAGNFVTLTNLPEQEMDRLIARRASPLYISVHTTNGALRKQMLRHVHADRIMEQMTRLARHGLSFHCQAVLCPGINDGAELEHMLEDLASLAPNALSVALVPVGLTRYRANLVPLRPFTAEEAHGVLRQAHAFQQRMLAGQGTRFVFPSDEFYQIAGVPVPDADCYEDFPQFENGVGLLARLRDEFETAARLDSRCTVRPRRVLVACGTSAAPFLRELLGRHPLPGVQVTIFPIINRFFGETVTVSGLITGQDLVEQLKDTDADEVLITQYMLREGDDVFLDGMTLEAARQQLNCRLTPVEDDGAALFSALRGSEE